MGDNDSGRMDAVLAAQAFETSRDVDDELRVPVLLVHLAKIGGGHIAVRVTLNLLETRPQGRVAAHHERRHGLRDPVAERIGKAEDPGPVSYRGTCFDRRERHDLRHAIVSVPLTEATAELKLVTQEWYDTAKTFFG